MIDDDRTCLYREKADKLDIIMYKLKHEQEKVNYNYNTVMDAVVKIMTLILSEMEI